MKTSELKLKQNSSLFLLAIAVVLISACVSSPDSRLQIPVEIRDYQLGGTPGSKTVSSSPISRPIINNMPVVPNNNKNFGNVNNLNGSTLATTSTKNWPRVSRMSASDANKTLMSAELGRAASSTASVTPLASAAPLVPSTPTLETPSKSTIDNNATKTTDNITFAWPAKGRVIRPFNKSTLKGIEIDGKVGESVYAAADGQVIYTGSGLRGYGKLIVVKHSGGYLSVYGHNSKILTKERSRVKRGVKIAEIGKSDSDRPKLFFQIRKDKNSLDPRKYLPKR